MSISKPFSWRSFSVAQEMLEALVSGTLGHIGNAAKSWGVSPPSLLNEKALFSSKAKSCMLTGDCTHEMHILQASSRGWKQDVQKVGPSDMRTKRATRASWC